MDPTSITIKGFKYSAVSAGIKHADSDKLDMGLIVADRPAVAVGLTTTNLVFAAPVEITRKRLSGGLCQALLVNSGNANAYTGARGKQDALDLTEALAKTLAIESGLVIPMSTGVIGHFLPRERMFPRIHELIQRLDPGSFMDVAQAIMTTDTRRKTVYLDGRISTGPFHIAGMAKGSGMIAPNMATMLGIILTDLRVEASFLLECLTAANDKSFNSITVDGDTSTNDTIVVLAGGSREAAELQSNSEDRRVFASLLEQACKSLAYQIVQDGEGATKVIDIQVSNAPDREAAARVARAVAESPLVKSAFHGEDPNWGRIICAAGRAGVPFEPDRIDLFIGDVPVVRDGMVVEGDWESSAHRVMAAHEFSIVLDLKGGEGKASLLTTDLSEEYVTINADYRS